MQILSDNDLFNIYGGSSIMVCTCNGLIKIIKWIFKFLSF